MLVAGVLAWALAWRFGWRELAIVASMCLVALVGGVLFLAFGKRTLVVDLDLTAPRVTAGEPASAVVVATNGASHRVLPVRLEARVGRTAAHLTVPALAAGDSYDELFVMPTRRRAVVPVGPVRSVRGDPLGLIRRTTTFTGTRHLFVHPRTIAIGSLGTGWRRDLEGDATNDRSASSVAFHTLRQYVAGDDRRHIHWRTTARQTDGSLMVREFIDTRMAHVGVLVGCGRDDFASDDEFELAVSALASLGSRCLADDQQLTCVAGGRLLPTYHRTTFLDALAGIEPEAGGPSILDAAARARDQMGAVSLLIVLTGSGIEPREGRTAAERVGSIGRRVVLRVDGGAESTVRAVSDTPILTMGRLEDLPRLVHAVSG
ncbi:MAG: DUF58 domain-containing protein [Actinobacteria bacterium]|nr:DUF58 domain-containing protein [Actinomycetota bacterium]